MRLEDKVALVVGAGQTPGEGMGNGRATALTFAREGARVCCADLHLDRAEDTAQMIRAAGGTAWAVRVDATDEAEVAELLASCRAAYGRLDILHLNVGVSLAGGDAVLSEITSEAFDRVTTTNLRSMVLAFKHALPIMREQGSGSITTVSSTAAVVDYPYVAYKTSKAGVIALTQHVAITSAGHGIRANTILPGLMYTPMAIENRIGVLADTREEVIALRDALVPLRGKMGTAWDVANAALFLNSDEASFITGVALLVDGGQSLRIG
jgi:NAD(P)-dependent dehydrogenase (short-subunit alcohol dehydrogenase family)